MMKEAWKRVLGISEQQYNTIWSKKNRVQSLWAEAGIFAMCGFDQITQTFRWYKYTEGLRPVAAKAPHELTEGERLADELVDLLRDEDSKDEQFRNTIDALQQARAKARQALPRAEQEMAAVLKTARLEAIFLIMGYID